MAESPNHDSPILGDRIRALRKRRKLTLAQLAAGCGLSVGYISQVERGLAYPSINALVAIARHLEVTVQWFFAGEDTAPVAERGYVIRKGNRLRVQYERGVVDELLTPKFNLQVEMIYTRMPPGTEASEAYSHDGDEVGFVLEGALEIWVGKRHFLLGPGDSCSFSSREPHRYRNPGKVETVIIWAISPPSY
ncbi:helix-turn-helix domain-containing protein [Phaeovulum sp.]|uniref:helix-turn-helix domain-containing protein n=1 Tax=Phaeovulum sp. TaxID=2934796 RepID=UPI0039E35500